MSISLAVLVATVAISNIATIISFFYIFDQKTDLHRQEMQQILRAIQEEMKDFHGRLCKIEERNKKP